MSVGPEATENLLPIPLLNLSPCLWVCRASLQENLCLGDNFVISFLHNPVKQKMSFFRQENCSSN